MNDAFASYMIGAVCS